jgi:hypothetical protein
LSYYLVARYKTKFEPKEWAKKWQFCLYPTLSQVPAILLQLCNLHIKERIAIQTKCGCDYASNNKGYTPCKEVLHMYEELDHSLPTSPLSMFHKKGRFCPYLKKYFM